jgi:PAS domain S-box-containing protein
MQKLIAGPITLLADVAHAITEKEDYSVRAPAGGLDEVGLLTSTFNGMLDRIQARETALEQARAELASQFESLQEKNLMMENAVEGIAILDHRQCYVSLNPAYGAMLGRAPEELIGHDPVASIHPEDLTAAAVAHAQMERDGKVTVELRALRKDGSTFHKEVTLIRHLGADRQFLGHYRFMKDITARKESEAELARLNHELQDTARHAGMAEIATGVLHNVGNVLNSVNTSASVVIEGLRKSEIPSLAMAVGLMRNHMDHLGEFLSTDHRGKQLPAFLEALAEQLPREQAALTEEMQGLQQNIDHIKQIVAMQQAYAKVSGVLENVLLDSLIEDALRLSANALVRHQVEVVREFEAVPPVVTDRHKVLQILVNLISNAKQALDNRPEGRRLILRIAPASAEHVKLEVTDNGVGIPQENLTRIFNHGFTTKKTGHGFGLHSGANAANELGGRLTAHSTGPGQGATFTLELPLSQSKTILRAA